MINVRDYGAVGDGSHDDYPAFAAAITAAKAVNANAPSAVYAPAGHYMVSQPIVTGDFRGLVGDGKTSTTIIAGASMPYVLDARTMNRGTLRDFHIDCAGLASTGIITDYSGGGPSLNNTYSDVFIENHLQYGWQANNNNDCYFERIFITYSGTASLVSAAPGGPLQFLNCNFLGEIHVAAQNISFSYCVTGGIVLSGSGYNLLKYEGGYAFASTNTKAVISIDGNLSSNNNYPTESGPITFNGSHIEMGSGGFLIGGKNTSPNLGLFHYGVNAIGCHIFDSSGSGTGSFIDVNNVTSVFAPAATSKFSNCMIQHMNTPTTIGAFTLQYENCYFDNYYNNTLNYLSLTGGDVTNVLGLPGVGQDVYGRASNRIVNGNGDGASYTTYNSVLRGHWGMALKDYADNINGYIDFRAGKIDMKGGFYVNGQQLPVLTQYNEGSSRPGFASGLPAYTSNTSAKSALGTGKLYQNAGVVMITY